MISPTPRCVSGRSAMLGAAGAGQRLLCVFAMLAGAIGIEHGAAASENYPSILDKQLGVDCGPAVRRCRICHDTASGGQGTANQPFALALKMNYGLSGGKAGRELAMALTLIPDDLDTDGDGTPDKEELRNCGNPSGPDLSDGPGFGCVAALAPLPASSSLPTLAGAATALILLASVMRRSRSR